MNLNDTDNNVYMNDLLSQIKILYSKIDLQTFSVLDSGEVNGNDVEELSGILFPFDATHCQYIFFVSFDEPQDYNMNNHKILLYCLFRCWTSAIKCRKDYLSQLNTIVVNAAHLNIENDRDFSKLEFTDKRALMRQIMGYLMKNQTDSSLYNWEQHDIIMGEAPGPILYGSSTLYDGCFDFAIPFVISNDLLEDLSQKYPFHAEASSITVLKILQSPFPIEGSAEKITYNLDNSIRYKDKIVLFMDTSTADRTQKNNTDDISRNSLNETIKPERKNYDITRKEDR